MIKKRPIEKRDIHYIQCDDNTANDADGVADSNTEGGDMSVYNITYDEEMYNIVKKELEKSNNKNDSAMMAMLVAITMMQKHFDKMFENENKFKRFISNNELREAFAEFVRNFDLLKSAIIIYYDMNKEILKEIDIDKINDIMYQ